MCFGDDYFSHNVVTQKMETPVIYFYSNEPKTVEVNVAFPEGVITETFPGPVASFPRASDAPLLANGRATFRVDVLNSKVGEIPSVDSQNIYAHARNVASNIVRTGREQEKFIFYRGLGRFQPRFRILSRGEELRLEGDNTQLPKAAFLVHVSEHGETRALELGDLTQASTSRNIGSSLMRALMGRENRDNPQVLGADRTRARLIATLVESGLRQDEAVAMLDTWEHGYLRVPGLRLLYILPRDEVDAVLPLSMTPAPQRLERVFVGRIEVLLEAEEQKIVHQVRAQKEGFHVASLGRFSEPILRRVSQVSETLGYASPQEAHELRQAFERLIQRAAQGEGVVSTSSH